MGVRLAALLWGFAEATLFFIVPDVLLTDRAVADLRSGLRACAWALAGSLMGGAAMYAWGARAPERALEVIEALPAISRALIDRVDGDLGERGVAAIARGSFTGRPYKIYAVQAGSRRLPPASFLMASVPGRIGRFLLLTLAASGLARGALKRRPVRQRRAILLCGWAVFYGAFFALMPN